jgi:hypothetical protein
MKRQFRLERMRAIEREFRVARIAAGVFKDALRGDPGLLFGEQLEAADAAAFDSNLERTYLLRLFAEFEQGLRDWWQNGLGRKREIRTFQLIRSAAAKRSIPSDDRDDAQAVREYRNSLIHEGDADAEPVSFNDARRALCKYFSRLPLDW